MIREMLQCLCHRFEFRDFRVQFLDMDKSEGFDVGAGSVAILPKGKELSDSLD